MSIQSSLIIPDDSNLDMQLAFQQAIYNFFKHASGIFCVLHGPDYTFELANPSFLRFVGQRELIGKTVEEVFPELKHQRFFDTLNKVYTKKISFSDTEMRLWFKQKDGTQKEVYANFTFQPVLNTKADVVGIIVSGYDITEQINVHKRIEEIEERMRLAIAASNIGIYDYDILMGKVSASEVMNVMFGITEPLDVDLFFKMMQLDEQGGGKKMYEEALESGTLTYQFVIQLPTGEKKWIETIGKVYYANRGTPIRLLGTVKDITIYKANEEKLATLAAIVESSDDLILSKGLDGIITSWNDAGERIMGYQADEMIGQHIAKLIPLNRQQEEIEIIGRLKTGQRIEHFETQRLRKDGSIIDLSLTISPIKNANGEIIGASKIARDVTKQKKNERLIIENEERLKIVIDASGLGTWELNAITREMQYSPKYLDILGFEQGATPSHEELLKRLHPEDRHIRTKAFEDAYITGTLFYVARIIWHDKSIHWIEAKGRAFFDEQKQPYKLVGTVRDVTRETNYQKELESREQKFRLLADSMPQLIWTSDAEGNMNYYNQSVLDYSGMTAEELGQEGWLKLLNSKERETSRKIWLEAIAGGELYKAEHQFKRHDGLYRWQLSRAVPQKDDEGNVIMWVGTSTDIHDWKMSTNALEEQVRQRTIELEESNEELSKLNNELAQFAYVASHDLQEPLRKIQTFSARIQEIEKDNLSDKGKDYFARLQNASKRMQQLILDLLAYSRANTAERHFEIVDLNELRESIEEQLRESIQQKNAVIESDSLPTMSIVPYQFEQLFTNLMTNALKFSKNEVKPHIKISYKVLPGEEIDESGIDKSRAYHHISFRDNGIGFEPEYNESIFQVFKRLHGKDEYPGTGIGLAIVKKIVENHAGIIRASGKIDEGAVFDMYFPVEESNE